MDSDDDTTTTTITTAITTDDSTDSDDDDDTTATTTDDSTDSDDDDDDDADTTTTTTTDDSTDCEDEDKANHDRMKQLIAGETAVFTDLFCEDSTMHVCVYSASWIYSVLKPSSPLNVEYIVGLFDHPLNSTSPPDSDIVNACHLHYTDTEGIHMVHRDGYIAESGFPYTESLLRTQVLHLFLRDSPFLGSLEIDYTNRHCMSVVLHCQTNFPIDTASLARDSDIRCSEAESWCATFSFNDDDKEDDDADGEENRTTVHTHSDGQSVITIEGRDASDPDAMISIIDRIWILLGQHRSEDRKEEPDSAVY